ncbi:MAG: hypothetical protein DRI48_05450 [Chloroflexi bacterium]|nr:MAG: hypothetical protein DRI48_05450 [Chloroflexota bacterium]
MITGIYQAAAILIVVVAFYTLDSLLISRYDRQRQAQGSGRSWEFTIVALTMVALMVVQPIAWPWLGIYTAAWWGACIQIIGLALIIGALILQTWARVHLRQFYAERVEIQPQHTVVDTGPYAHVRHPFFTSLFVFVIGLLLLNPSLLTLLVVIYTFWDFSRAARQEEALLSENLPGYAEYMAHTPRFIPRIRKSGGDE